MSYPSILLSHSLLIYPSLIRGTEKTAEGENVAVMQRVGACYVHSNACMIIISIVSAVSGIIGY